MEDRHSEPADHDDIDQRELFQHIVESSTGFAIFTMTSEGVATSWNIGAQRLFGFSRQEILSSSADVIFTAEDRAAGMPQREREAARADGRAADERWHQRKDGSLFWASGKGYGTELIERALPYQLRAKTKLEFEPDGVRCAIVVPVRATANTAPNA